MSKRRRRHSPEFKAEVAIAAVQAGRAFGQLSREFGVHRNLLRQWRDRLIDHAGKVFAEPADHVAEPDRSRQDAGRLAAVEP